MTSSFPVNKIFIYKFDNLKTRMEYKDLEGRFSYVGCPMRKIS